MSDATSNPVPSSSPAPSLTGRALLAVGLMVGFYVLALGIAAGLLWIPYAEMATINRIHLKLAFICLVGAGTILWSILPRFDKFEAPGPQLLPEGQPRLFAELQAVATATNQEMPKEVYLVPDVNAWVAQRGGMMGLGSKRVMGLGLPLMQALTVSELRAVLAHEFGHYHGGDTQLGPWIYKTRSAIGRTLQGLGDGYLRKPFQAYGNLFLRITHAISRRQEYTADALACRVAGSRALGSGLKKIHGAGAAYDAYWSNELVPVLGAGFVPSLTDGFRQFLGTSWVTQKVDEITQEAAQSGETDVYDTHPSLKERLAAAQLLPPGDVLQEDPPSTSLLLNLDALERRILTLLIKEELRAGLKPVSWDEIGPRVLVPQWQKALKLHVDALRAIQIEDVPEIAKKGFSLSKGEPLFEGDADARLQRCRWILAAALGLRLHEQGWRVEAPPGDTIHLRRDSLDVTPFEMVHRAADGEVTEEEWRGAVTSWGSPASGSSDRLPSLTATRSPGTDPLARPRRRRRKRSHPA